MRVDIRDKGTFQSLKPLDVVSYLRSNGWSESEVINEQASVWSQAGPILKRPELLVPLDPTLRDYVLRMSELFVSLATIEDRSEISILSDIQSSNTDTIRVRLFPENHSATTIRINEAVQAVTHTRGMLLAAACAAVDPREYYSSRKFSQSLAYIEELKLGQTETGSFIFKVHSYVPPVLQGSLQGLSEDSFSDDPFPRQVTRTLMMSLQAARKAAQRAIATAQIEPFVAAVAQGVSANLCDALFGLLGTKENSDFEVHMNWASNRSAPQNTPKSVVFSSDLSPVFEEASRVFKEKAPREEFELEGAIIRLEREDGPDPGKITVLGTVEERSRKVMLELKEQDFANAIQAFKTREPVRIWGSLVSSGRGLELKSPRHFRILRDD